MNAPEFSRTFRTHEVGQIRTHNIGANTAERAALAKRFDLLSLDRLEATLTLHAEAGVIVLAGQFSAGGSQPCARTGAPVPFGLAEPLMLRLVEAAPAGDDLELHADDLETEPLTSDIIDIGEYVAQALGVALDPYPRSTEAAPQILSEEQARVASSPFAILKSRQP